jgi:hypothetical protein
MAQVSEHLTSKHEILIPNPYTSIKNADCALWSIGLRHIGPWRVFKIWHGRPWSWSTVEGHMNPGSGSSVHCSLLQHYPSKFIEVSSSHPSSWSLLNHSSQDYLYAQCPDRLYIPLEKNKFTSKSSLCLPISTKVRGTWYSECKALQRVS